MFYRRKLILAILQIFEGKLPRINLQKILFLLTSRQIKPEYEFIPYKFGSYSYSANADLNTMVNKGLLKEDGISFTKIDKKNYLSLLNDTDRCLVNQIYLLYKNYDTDALMKHTYIKYPFYAINSSTAPRLLNKEQLQKVNDSRPVDDRTILFTIGYEGISLEAYLNKLLKNDIKILIDVRNNPLSQKYGFSKSTLKAYCNNLKIEYIHFAEVGIQSDLRQELNNQNDYDKLFMAYKKHTLTKTMDTQQKILTLLNNKQRVALTCFEANICQCHRKYLAEAITKLPGWGFELKHI